MYHRLKNSSGENESIMIRYENKGGYRRTLTISRANSLRNLRMTALEILRMNNASTLEVMHSRLKLRKNNSCL